ncbi:MAG: hypothetical protein H7228_10120, partial [Polaromonas sp.]|nr:hypothetical protein [Polaromonas sp.]
MSTTRLVLNPQTLLARVPAATFEQGVALYRSQQVLECELSRVNLSEWGVAGTVRGNKREVCEVSVVLEASPEGDITFFSSNCSCRMGINCQHGVALAVKAGYKAGNRPGNAEPEAGVAVEGSPSPVTADAPSTPPQAFTHQKNRQSLDLFSDDMFADEPVETVAKATAKPVRRPQAAVAEIEAVADLPPATPYEILQGITPTAHLHVTAVASESVEQLGLLRATLRFDYKGIFHYVLNDHNPVLVERAADGSTSPLLLQRDLATERAAHDAMRMFGLSGDTKGQFYLPFISNAQQQQWLQWLDDDFATLQTAGFVVTAEPRLSNWIARAEGLNAYMEPEGQDLAGSGASNTDLDTPGDAINAGHAAWFSLSLGMSINGIRRNILPLLPELLAQLSAGNRGKAASTGAAHALSATLQLPPYVYIKQDGGGYLRLPCEPLRPWLQALLELMAERSGHKDSDFKGTALRLSRLEALRVGAALLSDSREATGWQGSDKLREMVSQLAGHSALPDLAAPAGL